MPYVVPLPEARDVGRFGSKAAQLAALCSVPEVQVPPGFAVAAEAFDATVKQALPAPQWPERLLLGDPRDRRPDRLEAIRQRVLGARLAPGLEDELVRAWGALGVASVAVRSSALHEDSEGATAAGLQETILGVTGPEALVEAVLRCYASLWRERAISYLARLGPSAGRLAVALVVQRLVHADAAGVLFTVDPVRHAPGVMVVEAAVGLGTSVVDGALSPDVFRLEGATGVVLQRQVGDKPEAVRPRAQGGTERVSLDGEARTRPAVDDRQLGALASLGRAIEAQAGAPRDIEWAFEGERLWALQARPVVGLSALGGSDRARHVWSNVNVGEALPGVATPFTWSIAATFSELGFRRAFGALGCTVPPEAELVGCFHGRIYLNLTWFLRIASQVPLLDARMLLEFGGGGGLEEVEAQVPKGAWGTFLARLPATGARYLSENTGIDRKVEAFERAFQEAREALEARDLGALSDAALREILTEQRALLDRTGVMMLTCASGYLASVVGLRSLLRFAVRGDAERFERELLAGVNDLESAAPGIRLFHLAQLARTDPAAREAILAGDPATLRLTDLPEGPTRKAFGTFLKAFGYRCPREAELSTPRWREAPGVLFAALRAHLERDDAAALERVERQHQARAAAERELSARIPWAARAALRHLLARMQRFARLRERMRARVTEVLGFLRTVALEAGQRLSRRFPEAGPDGVFMLSLEELDRWLTGSMESPVALIVARRAQFQRDLGRPDPPPTFVGAPPTASLSQIPEGDRWEGVVACPGVVEGVVRVLRDPSDGALLRAGEVLVTPVTDVGWTPLFLVAAAVVTELGGALSHAALVAREYGVPTVVSVQGITRALHTGDRVQVDANQGVIVRLERAPAGHG
ncbi:MAG: phosphoenolpyruvate synthase [Deltaproteobacteria bacterium]|nr:phosphoenolpyruvate synthase [Deltaproteobacteria bacterium]